MWNIAWALGKSLGFKLYSIVYSISRHYTDKRTEFACYDATGDDCGCMYRCLSMISYRHHLLPLYCPATRFTIFISEICMILHFLSSSHPTPLPPTPLLPSSSSPPPLLLLFSFYSSHFSCPPLPPFLVLSLLFFMCYPSSPPPPLPNVYTSSPPLSSLISYFSRHHRSRQLMPWTLNFYSFSHHIYREQIGH